ncbi:MAG: hypothetical protein F6K00_28675 [Leptolyngbya sp. SIOISBB]|nr:hypothetical protein [Leptolyngbya sp. SIOISBB]
MITTQAQQLGATIIRQPFDTPGVGRSSVIQDQQGAIIGATLPTHTFPAPKGTFIGDELITNDVTAAERFYGELFGWPSPGTDTVSVRQASLGAAGFAAWVPYFATQDVEATLTQAKRLGASEHQTFTDQAKGPPKIVLADPMGALFGLVGPNA